MASAGRSFYWDALLLAKAAEAVCTAILTEDPADRSILLSVRVANPFSGDGLSAAADGVLAGA